MEAKKVAEIGKICIGMKCAWNTTINGKISRIKGTIVSVPNDLSYPFEVEGEAMDGITYKDKVYLDDNSFYVFPNWASAYVNGIYEGFD